MKDSKIDIEDRLIENLAVCEDAANKLVMLAKENTTNIEQLVYVNKEGNDETIFVYDFKKIAWKSTDTFDKLAVQFYSDANYGTLIAYYNKIQNEDEIEAGTEIRIPIFTQTTNIFRNKIYSTPEQRENYGRDIRMKDGKFELFGNDFAFTVGQETLAQSIDNRLNTSFKKRIRLGAYGIRASIGDTAAVNSYLVSSIEQTILEDPRISAVTGIEFKHEGSALTVLVKYKDINSTENSHEVLV